MKRQSNKTGICQVSKKELPLKDLVPGHSIRRSILELIQKSYPDFDTAGYISHAEINKFRDQHIRNMILKDNAEISADHQMVLDSFSDADLVSKNIAEETDEKLTIGERIADKVAIFGGSWMFIIIFFIFILLWMLINAFLLLNRPFDPYPFILLNLILSCLAAIQAPIIMMSQNRLESKDRARSKNDYLVNLKAELEVRQLHEKLDHIAFYRIEELYKNQEMQLDYLEKIAESLESRNKTKLK
jgi:uncharacterized membrane protein